MFASEQVMKQQILKGINQLEEKLTEIFSDEWGKETTIKFVGEEINLGTGRCDLLFAKYAELSPPGGGTFKTAKFVIVELKNRVGACEDLGQIARYINGLNIQMSKTDLDDYEIKGVLLCCGLSDGLREIEILEIAPDIKFIELQSSIKYEEFSFSYKEEFEEKYFLDKNVLNFFNKNKEV